ncbi:F0F1 ATP synthase subunit B family protein [Rickettsiales endosymbiont of Stachyamoeba lipophora]|uniref:F0F1 ATP synthase subunit B family protein n=1 Tax=Rickettsiales endosymbiont of Stachyamoeba lipophora TaxID=2486578 RepID=UPI000F653DDE|nr:hypothetical protein [Rickettsiales endosymbiont of Stachyamoeba lipophora]AZL15747.1 hypothetical protein EF513_04200 [Rickettsiales endosymbiont of Stachyamoeba lipophora]
MPQLDLSTYLSQVFWLIVAFGLLFAFLCYYITPHLGGIIKNRGDKIKSDLLQAEQLKKNAKSLDDNIEVEIRNAHKAANQRITKAVQECQEKLAESMIEKENEIVEKALLSENKINKFIEESKDNIDELVHAIAQTITERLLSKPVSRHDITNQIKLAQKLVKKT